MSQLRVPSVGEVTFLDLMFADDVDLRLYRTDVETGLTETQLEALDETDFTEANFTGYAAASLTGGSWTTSSGDPSFARYAQQTFTRTSTGTAQLIYGYYVTLDSDGSLLFYEQFDGPVSIEFNGDALRVTPNFNLDEGDGVPTGQITAFGGASAPTGWLMCDGTAVSRTTQASLFAVLGTTYGVGDGSTTFNVPDLRQRFPLGKAASGTGNTLGGTGGTIDHVHALDTATSHARLGTETTADIIYHQRKTVSSYTETVVSDAATIAFSTGSASRTLGTTLGGNSDTANAPFQVVNYIIKT